MTFSLFHIITSWPYSEPLNWICHIICVVKYKTSRVNNSNRPTPASHRASTACNRVRHPALKFAQPGRNFHKP